MVSLTACFSQAILGRSCHMQILVMVAMASPTVVLILMAVLEVVSQSVWVEKIELVMVIGLSRGTAVALSVRMISRGSVSPMLYQVVWSTTITG